MSLYALGLSHATAPLDVREKVAFAPDVLPDALRDLTRDRRVREATILSTCNRTEVYFHGGDPQRVADWLEDVHHLPRDGLAPYVYTLPHDKAVAHAFRVASGLESMVLGEPQILGQMKQAVRTAEAAGALGLVLNRLFQRTFAVAKDVRTHTEIGTASISMAAAAVKLAQRIFPSIADQRLLLIGAGEMIELAATHFAAQKPRSIAVANRTLERGEKLAEGGGGGARPRAGRPGRLERGEKLADRFGAEAITLAELPERLAQFDIIVTCTASTLPIIGKGTLERVVKLRRHAPIFIADLAVPRDVEAEAARLDDVFLYGVDDLTEIVKDNLAIRREAITEAERMIAEQTAHFLRWLDGRAVVPTIAALSRHHDALREAEIERARRLLAGGATTDEALDALARGLTSKLLHAPLAALNAAGDAERAELIAVLMRVYKLADGEDV
jgi:glutamyl-tRNA reductase